MRLVPVSSDKRGSTELLSIFEIFICLYSVGLCTQNPKYLIKLKRNNIGPLFSFNAAIRHSVYIIVALYFLFKATIFSKFLDKERISPETFGYLLNVLR